MKAIEIVQELIDAGQNVRFLESTLKEAIKEHNDFIEWLKEKARTAKTWAEHSAFMEALRKIEEMENEQQ